MWFGDIWLAVNTSRQALTVTGLSREIRKKIPKDRYVLVMEVKPIDLAGVGPKVGWKWTDENWPGHW
jgi:hypothetical protein